MWCVASVSTNLWLPFQPHSIDAPIDKAIGAIMYDWFSDHPPLLVPSIPGHTCRLVPTAYHNPCACARACALATQTARAWNHTVEFAKICVTHNLDDECATRCSFSTYSNIKTKISKCRPFPVVVILAQPSTWWHTCSLDTSAFSALEVLGDYCAI